jgi:hypothetical protein
MEQAFALEFRHPAVPDRDNLVNFRERGFALGGLPIVLHVATRQALGEPISGRSVCDVLRRPGVASGSSERHIQRNVGPPRAGIRRVRAGCPERQPPSVAD